MRYSMIASLVCVSLCFGAAGAQDLSPPEDFPINVEDMETFDAEQAEKVVSSLNPLENDLRGLEIAVRLHQGFLIKPEGGVFHLGVTDGSGETRLDEEFILIETSDVEAPLLTAEQREGFEFWTYRLAPEDYPRMQAGDALLQELKRLAPGQNQLKFNAQAYTCANPNLDTPDEYRIAMFARTAPDVDFVPLSAGDLIVEKENAGVFAFAWEDCDF